MNMRDTGGLGHTLPERVPRSWVVRHGWKVLGVFATKDMAERAAKESRLDCRISYEESRQ